MVLQPIWKHQSLSFIDNTEYIGTPLLEREVVQTVLFPGVWQVDPHVLYLNLALTDDSYFWWTNRLLTTLSFAYPGESIDVIPVRYHLDCLAQSRKHDASTLPSFEIVPLEQWYTTAHVSGVPSLEYDMIFDFLQSCLHCVHVSGNVGYNRIVANRCGRSNLMETALQKCM